ncbi:MAG: bifunctional glutamate N-acetyltransferase/amino-acid acetyltransferase ArgJ [Candidatus Omnitrophica bacterium]|nr:bifunctional glutamate N-acetyltransferase/amino-acid acetyltransferase ArgJ [Candidatus Omnitrophota bacterium]
MKVFYKAVLPKGFKASAAACGLKKSGKLDLALFYSIIPAQASAMFTSNKMAAAPVKVCREHLKNTRFFQAIIANSGNANCFTGLAGMKACRRSVEVLAKELVVEKKSILVGSTGVIGKPLDFMKIEKAIPALVKNLSSKGISLAEKAIMTTDKFPKTVTVKFRLGLQDITVCGVAKGAGMIAPHMATMFAFIFTDAAIARPAMKEALKEAVENSFNRVTVDGCMSTNDTVILLANGCAENKLIQNKSDKLKFAQAINTVCRELAKMMVKDGEGASKFIEIKVERAATVAEAKKAGLAIANSNLFKTAIYGENPNFGRIVAAVGACGIKVKEENLKIDLGDLKKKNILVRVSLGRGKAGCIVYTSDLTPEYIKINAAYN